MVSHGEASYVGCPRIHVNFDDCCVKWNELICPTVTMKLLGSVVMKSYLNFLLKSFAAYLLIE